MSTQLDSISKYLPVTQKEVEANGWDEIDVIIFSGDAYVDHPSFGPAVIGRVIEDEGFRVAIVRSRTGKMISEISGNLGSQSTFLLLPLGIWIQW